MNDCRIGPPTATPSETSKTSGTRAQRKLKALSGALPSEQALPSLRGFTAPTENLMAYAFAGSNPAAPMTAEAPQVAGFLAFTGYPHPSFSTRVQLVRVVHWVRGSAGGAPRSAPYSVRLPVTGDARYPPDAHRL